MYDGKISKPGTLISPGSIAVEMTLLSTRENQEGEPLELKDDLLKSDIFSASIEQIISFIIINEISSKTPTVNKAQQWKI